MFFPVAGFRFAAHLSPQGRHLHVRFHVVRFWFVRGVGGAVNSPDFQSRRTRVRIPYTLRKGRHELVGILHDVTDHG
jgi:hypothetical protein